VLIGDKMKKLNLEDTWKYCMRMWRWIADRIGAGDKRTIVDLKDAWIEKHNVEYLVNNCFFCQYNFRPIIRDNCDNCDNCPARKINKGFHCGNVGYAWHSKPIKFYNQLRKLNKLRKLGRKL
jgi:hypothetical protein